ncbi:MAG TPA: ABC transporter substrate-binding protein [Dehalococcoidia bacterium]
MWRRVRWLMAVVTVLGVLAMACSSGEDDADRGAAAPAEITADSRPEEMTEASIVMNWFPEPEHGGYYYAALNGLYEDWNVDATIEPGGPGIDTVRLVASGQAKFGVGNGDQLARGRNEGIPVVALMAPFQVNPQVIMVHEESGVQSLADIGKRGTRVAVARAAAYVPYLMKTFGWKEEQLLAYNGQLAEWLNDKERGTQGYLTTEPYYARQAGARPKSLLIADSGYNPYANILFTTEEVIREEPELVNAVVAASLEGWRRYMEEPEETHAYLKTLAPDLTDDGMRYNWETMQTLVPVGDAAERGIGVMTAQRWETLYQQLKDVEAIRTDLDPADIWTDRFFSLHLPR